MRKAGANYTQFCELIELIKSGKHALQISKDYVVMSRSHYQELCSKATGINSDNKIIPLSREGESS